MDDGVGLENQCGEFSSPWVRIPPSPLKKKYMKDNQVLISGAVVFKEARDKKRPYWLLIKPHGEEEWQIPKTAVRRGESSVRAALRMMGEVGGMSTKVLEEAGRASANLIVNKKPVAQRYIFYLMLYKSAGEALGFAQEKWLKHKDAIKKLTPKREILALRQAKEVFDKWLKEREKKR